jgi:hypothetical protein
MKIPDRQIRESIVELLNGAISQPVRDTISLPDDTYPRVVIAGFNTFQDGSKSQFMFSTNFTLRVTDKHIRVGNANQVQDTANDIMQLLCPTPAGPFPVIAGFEIWSVELNGTQENNYNRKDIQYIEKNLNITIKTEQL